MKQFQCGTLVPGCQWHTHDEDEAEIVRNAVEHMRVVHGEQIIRESMVEAIKQRIRPEQEEAA
jgi:predicted small metal-binding protein